MTYRLPINKEPLIRAYTTSGFVDAIISNELAVGNKLAEFYLYDYQKTLWQESLKGIRLESNNNLLSVFVEPYQSEATGQVYRVLNKKDELMIRIDSHLFANPWETFSISIRPMNKESDADDEIYSIGKFVRGGLFVRINEQVKSYFNENHVKAMPYWLKFEHLNSGIKCMCSCDGETWETLECAEVQKSVDGYYCIGVDLQYRGNQYFNWLFSNFIQLNGGTQANQGLPIMYSGYTYKSYTLCVLNPFITAIPIRRDLLLAKNFSLWDFIVENISMNRYIEVNIDEFYIPGTQAYNAYRYPHGNLIFGYDSDGQNVDLLHYYNGKPKIITVAYQDLINAFEKCEDVIEFINLYEYYRSQVGYGINVERVCTMLQYYLSGDGYHDIGLGIYAEPQNVVYGIELYDDYIKDYPSIDVFLNDVRISYMFNEHKNVMRERIKYLISSGVVCFNEAQEIVQQIETLTQLSQMLMYLVMKNMMQPILDIYAKVTHYMTLSKSLELKTYSNLINILRQKLCKISFNAKNPYGTLTALADGIHIKSGNFILKGKNVVFEAIPQAGYTVDKWILEGDKANSSSTSKLEVNNIYADINVTMIFVQIID